MTGLFPHRFGVARARSMGLEAALGNEGFVVRAATAMLARGVFRAAGPGGAGLPAALFRPEWPATSRLGWVRRSHVMAEALRTSRRRGCNGNRRREGACVAG